MFIFEQACTASDALTSNERRFRQLEFPLFSVFSGNNGEPIPWVERSSAWRVQWT